MVMVLFASLTATREETGLCIASAAALSPQNVIIIQCAPCPWARPTFVFISQISRLESSCMNLLSTDIEEQENKRGRHTEGGMRERDEEAETEIELERAEERPIGTRH